MRSPLEIEYLNRPDLDKPDCFMAVMLAYYYLKNDGVTETLKTMWANMESDRKEKVLSLMEPTIQQILENL